MGLVSGVSVTHLTCSRAGAAMTAGRCHFQASPPPAEANAAMMNKRRRGRESRSDREHHS